MPYQAPTNPPQLPDLNANFMDEQYYQKNPDGKYWFEFLNSNHMTQKGEAWAKMISASMADYFTIVKAQGHTPENHEGFMNYLTTASLFLTLHEFNIILPANAIPQPT